MISHAEKRIFISSLYIGGEEAELVSAIGQLSTTTGENLDPRSLL